METDFNEQKRRADNITVNPMAGYPGPNQREARLAQEQQYFWFLFHSFICQSTYFQPLKQKHLLKHDKYC